MSGIIEYRKEDNVLSWKVLQSCYRHMWYMAAQLVSLALTDKDLEEDSKEKMARALHSQERTKIETGKPTFPVLCHGFTVTRKDMASLVTSDSWLVFDLLGLTGPQDWLLSPVSSWHKVSDFLVLHEFSQNLVVVNDLAERGIHLATEFVNRVQSEEQRNALFQVVEDFRSRVDFRKDTVKSSLKLC
jgi:hypothetical protein